MRDPQVMHWMNYLLLVALVIIVLIAIADFILLAVWLVHRYQLSRSETYGAPSQELFGAPLAEQPHLAGESEPQERSETEREPSDTEPLVEETTEEPSEPAAPTPDTQYPEPALPVSPFAPKWSLAHVFVGGQAVILLVNLLAAIPIFVVTFALVLRPHHITGGLQNDPLFENVTLYTIIGSLFVQNALFVGVVAYFLKRYGLTLKDIGLQRPTGRQILLGLGLGLAMLILAWGAEKLTGGLADKVLGHVTATKLAKFGESLGAGGAFQGLHSFVPKLLFLLGGAVAAPIGEEVFFRGFLYNALKFRFNVPVAIIVSGLLFALVHISPLALIVIFPMGMLLAYVYEKTQSLWVTILIHIVNNGVALILAWRFPHFSP